MELQGSPDSLQHFFCVHVTAQNQKVIRLIGVRDVCRLVRLVLFNLYVVWMSLGFHKNLRVMASWVEYCWDAFWTSIDALWAAGTTVQSSAGVWLLAVVKSCHHSVAAAYTTRPRDLLNFARIAIVFNLGRLWLILATQPFLFPPASPIYLFLKSQKQKF